MPALLIFLVARLFADHHDRNLQLLCFGSSFQFSKHRLCSILIEIATPAGLNRFLEDGQRSIIRYKWCRTLIDACRHEKSSFLRLDACRRYFYFSSSNPSRVRGQSAPQMRKSRRNT